MSKIVQPVSYWYFCITRLKLLMYWVLKTWVSGFLKVSKIWPQNEERPVSTFNLFLGDSRDSPSSTICKQDPEQDPVCHNNTTKHIVLHQLRLQSYVCVVLYLLLPLLKLHSIHICICWCWVMMIETCYLYFFVIQMWLDSKLMAGMILKNIV